MPVATTSTGNDTNTTVFNLTAAQQLLVTQSGFVYQLGATGYAVDAANSVKIVNYGGIFANAAAIRVTGFGTDTVNYGSIDGQIRYENTTGPNYIDNYGTIAVRDGQTVIQGTTTADEVVRNFGTITGIVKDVDYLVNRGTINGDVDGTFNSTSPLEVINRGGVINGSIRGTAGDNFFDLVGGTLTGTAFGNRGNDTFRLDSSAATGLEVIADFGGGLDVLDFSVAGSAVWVDLMFPGIHVWTSGLGVATGANANTALAYVVGVENITGSFGSDTLYGSNDDNVFDFVGNQPGTPDRIFGRGGTDTIDLSFMRSVWVDLNYAASEVYTSNTAVSTGANASTVLVDLDGVENIIGTNGADHITGDAFNNTFFSNGSAYNAGLERFNGGGGIDTIDLSQGVQAAWVDLAFAGTQIYISNSTLFANGSNATIAFGVLANVENVVGTRNTSDYILGDGANNTYFFNGFHSAVAEYFDGRGGNDTFDASKSDYSVYVNLAAVAGLKVWTSFTATSNGGNAPVAVANLVSVENITGSAYNDTINGDANANRINGGMGTDALFGDGGADIFVFRQLSGADTITSFDGVAGDTIELSGFAGRTTFAQVFANSVQNGSHTVINLGFDPAATIETTITLLNYTRTNLVADDFIFV